MRGSARTAGRGRCRILVPAASVRTPLRRTSGAAHLGVPSTPPSPLPSPLPLPSPSCPSDSKPSRFGDAMGLRVTSTGKEGGRGPVETQRRETRHILRPAFSMKGCSGGGRRNCADETHAGDALRRDATYGRAMPSIEAKRNPSTPCPSPPSWPRAGGGSATVRVGSSPRVASSRRDCARGDRKPAAGALRGCTAMVSGPEEGCTW